MKPQLYIDTRSPPVRSVLLLIEALGIDVEKIPIDLAKGEQYSENYLKLNPLHTVPTYQDSKVTLTDSHAILIYLCEQFSEDSSLWPSDPIERINVLNKLFYSGTLLFRRDSDAMGQIIINKLKKDQVEEHVVKIREQLNILESFLSLHEFVASDQMTIADLSIVTIVSTVDMIAPITEEQWPKLYDWWNNKMRKLQYYEKVNQDGLLALKEWVKESTDYPIKME